jgi:hypothetical protein
MFHRLKEYLQRLPAGSVPHEQYTQLMTLLGSCWDEFRGVSDTKMGWWKVLRDGGPRDLIWHPPILSFTIERHGSLVLGSTRAEKQRWSLDLENCTASADTVGHRQVHQPAGPFRSSEMAAMAEKICSEIQEGPSSTSDYSIRGIIAWAGPDQVHIKHGELVPPAAFQRTTAGRRKRFRSILESKMQAIGWTRDPVGRPMTFRRVVER